MDDPNVELTRCLVGMRVSCIYHLYLDWNLNADSPIQIIKHIWTSSQREKMSMRLHRVREQSLVRIDRLETYFISSNTIF